jgi:hypothetical protein
VKDMFTDHHFSHHHNETWLLLCLFLFSKKTRTVGYIVQLKLKLQITSTVLSSSFFQYVLPILHLLLHIFVFSYCMPSFFPPFFLAFQIFFRNLFTIFSFISLLSLFI